MSHTPDPRSAADGSAPHYRWGEGCDGWRLLDQPGLSVIEEQVPAGCGEIVHRHAHARQCFYLLSGAACIEVEGESIPLRAGQALEVPPGSAHRFHNPGSVPVRFLVISSPNTRGDRQDL